MNFVMNFAFQRRRVMRCGTDHMAIEMVLAKYLIASLDQSLRRMKLDYVDIFYHHVFDPDTPLLEETAHAFWDQIVRQGKALYVGISNYNAEQTERMQQLLTELGTPFYCK